MNRLAITIATLAIAAWSPPAPAQPPAPPVPPSPSTGALDRALLEGLPGAKKSSSANQQPSALPASPGEPPTKAENPLDRIAHHMQVVSGRLAAHDASDQTQDLQAQILKQLDDLLQQAQIQQPAASQQPAAGRAAAPQPGIGTGDPALRPPSGSSGRSPPAGSAPPRPADVRVLLSHVWGHLPDKLREQMQSSLSEQFLPPYERVIEQYYERLAEERPAAP